MRINALRRYIQMRWRLYGVAVLFGLIFFITFQLYHLPLSAVAYPALLCTGLGLIFSIMDFFRVMRTHQALQRFQQSPGAPLSLLPKAENLEALDYQQMLRQMEENHQAARQHQSQQYEEMLDYYTVWVHQIKTPMASMRLHLQNEDTPLTRQMQGDLHRIEQYVGMVLTYLRLHGETTDYVFRPCDVDTLVRQAVKNFAAEFITRKIKLVYQPVSLQVVTDEKWLSFVIQQVLSNALKYTQTGCVTLSVDAQAQTLTIRDTGIGIAPEDLPRIFDSGFTGYNGRSHPSASGLGLYLCKQICTRLGHTITATSKVGEGTAITISLYQEKQLHE